MCTRVPYSYATRSAANPTTNNIRAFAFRPHLTLNVPKRNFLWERARHLRIRILDNSKFQVPTEYLYFVPPLPSVHVVT